MTDTNDRLAELETWISEQDDRRGRRLAAIAEGVADGRAWVDRGPNAGQHPVSVKDAIIAIEDVLDCTDINDEDNGLTEAQQIVAAKSFAESVSQTPLLVLLMHAHQLEWALRDHPGIDGVVGQAVLGAIETLEPYTRDPRGWNRDAIVPYLPEELRG